MLEMKINLSGDVKEKLQNLLNGLTVNRHKLHKQVAEKVASDLRKKFRSNKGESWWKEAAGSVETSFTNESASIVATQRGVRLHRYGGTVYPKNAKRLAIPLRPEFKRVSPKRLGQTRPVFLLKSTRIFNNAYLAYRDGSSTKLAYLLTPKAVIKPHPESFLTDEQINNSVMRVINIYTNKLYGLSI